MTVFTEAMPVVRRRRARSIRLPRVSVPSSVRKLAEIPLTTLGLGGIFAGISLVCLPAALIVGGLALIGLEYVIADD